MRVEQGEVLSDPATPGDAEHVCLIVAELGEQARHQPAQAGEAVGQAGQRRAADSRDVETDDLDGGIERVDERLEQLQAGADAVDQQQRRPPAGPGRT